MSTSAEPSAAVPPTTTICWRLPGGGAVNRNVRTMPLQFSPVDNHTMFYASNVVWKSLDKGHAWTRISPDLTRQTWAVPANAGKYAGTVKPAPMGSITALARIYEAGENWTELNVVYERELENASGDVAEAGKVGDLELVEGEAFSVEVTLADPES